MRPMQQRLDVRLRDGSYSDPRAVMTGATVSLGLAEQALLARWAEKTAFVWEFVDEKHPVSSKPQRRAFKAGEESST